MNEGHKRVLFLSFWVPPRNAIGTLRSRHIIKHLPGFGWDVTTVTAQFNAEPSSGAKPPQCIETRYCDVKETVKRFAGIANRSTHEALDLAIPKYGSQRSFLQRLLYEASAFLTYPDDYVGWLPFASATMRAMLRSGTWNAVLTSSPPVTTNIAAALAHRRVPWIADFRDLWAENDSSEHSWLQAMLDGPIERACVSQATALTAASELSAARFRRRYPGTPCFGVPNGFDEEEWQSIEFGTERACTLLYAGSLYRGKRDPSMLFAALRKIIDEGLAEPSELSVDFYSDNEAWLHELVGQFNLADVARVHGFVERSQVLAAQRRADRLIVLSWDSPTAEGVVAGKLFEYFGARRPVMALGGPASSAVENLLKETGAGVRCRTIEETKAVVMEALAEHRSGSRRVVSENSVSEYTGRNCARRFATILDYATETSGFRTGLYSRHESSPSVR